MSWQNKISVGLYRIALILGVTVGLIGFLLFYQHGLLNAILAFIIAFGVTVGVIALLNWVIRGFTG